MRYERRRNWHTKKVDARRYFLSTTGLTSILCFLSLSSSNNLYHLLVPATEPREICSIFLKIGFSSKNYFLDVVLVVVCRTGRYMGQTLSHFINCRVVLADFRDTQRTAPQLKFTCSKSTVETLEEDLKYAQIWQKKNTFEQVNISWVHTNQMITLDKSEG